MDARLVNIRGELKIFYYNCPDDGDFDTVKNIRKLYSQLDEFYSGVLKARGDRFIKDCAKECRRFVKACNIVLKDFADGSEVVPPELNYEISFVLGNCWGN